MDCLEKPEEEEKRSIECRNERTEYIKLERKIEIEIRSCKKYHVEY